MARMDGSAFEQLVADVLDNLPGEFGRHLDVVEVQIAARPSRAQRRSLGLKPAETLYGLYEGVPLTERSSDLLLTPDLITIFQEPLERDFPNPDQLRAQVRRTVLHEIAHFFGISDERLHELDAY